MNAAFITEDWLRDCGFKWEQHERQPSKHWLLWIGSACLGYDRTNDPDSLGVELAKHQASDLWYCWIRSDIAGRYARIIHVRYVYLQSEVEAIIEALTGRKINWKDSLYGSLRSPTQAEHLRSDRGRLDQQINLAWADRVDADKGIIGIDKDKRGAALP